ncbi:MAG: hypothetical protein IKT61_01795 [Clostridia bacterium]|nr:hypothetical protein [Clostridia bacterium]
MITYDLMLEKQRLLGADRFTLAANANETLCLRFNFDRHWRCFDSKAAVFRNASGEYFIIEITSNRAKVPWEVLTQKGSFELSVIGFDGIRTITSDTAELIVSENLLPDEYKTYSPSEVLFDRFREECIAEAYVKYEDEIKALKAEHVKEKLLLGEQIAQAHRQAEEAIDAKETEFRNFKTQNNLVLADLNGQITQLKNTLAEIQPKAENWDMVDYAISVQKSSTAPLWAGGTEPYSLPMLNTCLISGFSSGNFSANLREVGLDLSNITTFGAVFSNKNGIEKLTLRNTNKVTSFSNLFEVCKTIKEVTLGDIRSCTSLTRFAYEASNLEKLTFSNMVRVQSLERAFCNCLVLKEIDGEFNLLTATDLTGTFINCCSLETIRFKEKTIRKTIGFLSCINLSRQSMLSIVEGLSDEVSGTVTFSVYAFENVFETQEERDEIIDYITETKGWILSLG